MVYKKQLLCTLMTGIFGFMLPQATMAQDAATDVFGFDASSANNVTVTQQDDGSWTLNTQGDDPFVSTTGLARDLTADEITLTLEYKASDAAGVEIFFSHDAGVYEGGRSIVAGTLPATSEWTRVNVDISGARTDWAWGKAGQTLRLDAGNTGGLRFQVRDFRITGAVDVSDLFETKDGVIQINTQEDFDKWVENMASPSLGTFLAKMDLDLNTDITVVGTGCIVENYKGVFNGNYHTIDLQLNREISDQGLALIRDLDGTFQNAYITGTIEGVGQFFASVAQDLNGGSLVKNVYSTVNFISHKVGDGTHGGIAARFEGDATLKNVVWAGKMFNPGADPATGTGGTHSCGGLVGWMTAAGTIEGCLMIGDMSELDSNGCNTIGRNQGNIKGRGIFATSSKNEVPASCTIVTAEDFLDGSICYAMNGDQSEIGWYQTIGVDAMPTFDNRDGSHKQVFAVGDFNCDGTPLSEDITYNNESGSPIPDHSYTDGVCVNCGQAQPGFVEQVDGWYIITTPEQLCYISTFASNNPKTNIKIAADLDMSGYDYTPITGAYAGTFDGQHHTISNLIINNTVNDQALIGVAGSCTIKNLTLDNTCSISGAAYCAGFVGETSGSVTITMEGLIMHGNVTGTGANIAAIYGCNMGSTATVKMTNCGMSGMVVGGSESGLISGWFAGGMSTLKGVWAVGQVTGSDNTTTAVFCRPSGDTDVSFTNCWSVQGERTNVGKLSEDAAETGELTWKLNGESFVNPTWFQNLNEGDAYPSLKSSRGVVYPTVDGYASFDPADPAQYETFVKGFVGVAEAFLESEDVQGYAAVSLVEEYTECIAAYAEATDLEAFVPIWEAEKAKRAELENSINAYKNYEAVIEEILAELESRDDFSGPDRDFLEGEYIDGGLAPGDDERAPNGSSDYILENRELTTAEVNKEADHAKELLRLAVAGGYEAGTEITNLLVNANFADGWNGWTTNFYGYAKDTREGGTMVSAEVWNADARHLYQEIIASKAGVYELQIRGGYRPFDEQNSIQYYPYIHINGNANYLQAIIEDYIPVEEAVDGENCYITPGMPTLDRPITNEEGDTIGWAIHGTQSCCVAFTAGRYDNRILINANEGDTLRIGVNHPYSGFGSNEWLGIGDIHLTYHGELEASDEALDRVLESMLARAEKLLAIQHRTDADYVKYPNYSQALKDQVAASIEKAAGAADAATKYEVIEELSAAFLEIIDCKKAYQSFFAKVEDVYSYAFGAAEIDPNCATMGAQAQTIMDEGMAAYDGGTMTTEEAAECAIINGINAYPTVDENGVYHIANTAQYAAFVDIANANTTADNGAIYNAVLEADVYMNTGMVINNFYGTFDGQDHTLTVDIVPASDMPAAPFTNLRGATVKNLIVKGTISTPYKFAAGIAAHSYEANGRGSTMDRIQSWVDIAGSNPGDGTHGGILAVNDGGTGYITNSMFAGSMSGTANSNGGIVGWSAATTHVDGCLVIANITAGVDNSNVIGRNSTQAKNTYYVPTYGAAVAGATQVTEERLASGEVALGLNGGSTRKDVVWRQNLDGSDIYPVLDSTHKIVYKKADGGYTNEIQNEIEKHEGSKEDPYIINTAQDMALLRSFLVPGRVNYVKLGADIDMAGITEWYPLNMEEDQANGYGYQNLIDFDGQGHVISNFSDAGENDSYNSFFGILNGEVRNVGFKDAYVYSKNSGTGILAGYMGHDQYLDVDATKKTSILTNVWVTGKLEVATSYAGGMIGNIGGPSVIKNCYTNIEITSNATYVGGIVGRVRDQLSIDQAYAAGTIISESEDQGGIIGGGQMDATTPGYYNNIVVWNNTDQNFGTTKPALEMTIPAADLLDVVFNEDGTATDMSPMQHAIEAYGTPKVQYSEKYGQNVFFSEADDQTPISMFKVDYSANEEFKTALADGYSLEMTFAVRQDDMSKMTKPFSSEHSAGLGFELLAGGQFRHTIVTTADGTSGAYYYPTTSVTAVPNQYYHVVGVYDKATQKAYIYVNGANATSADVPNDLYYSPVEGTQYFGIGADAAAEKPELGGNFEIVNARIYNEPMSEIQAKALYFKQKSGMDFFAGDKVSNISYYNGSNFAELQGVVVAWDSPWQCDMTEGTYPTFDGTLADGIKNVTLDNKGKIFNINGIQVEKTTKGLYIIDGKKVMVK